MIREILTSVDDEEPTRGGKHARGARGSKHASFAH